MQLLCAVARGVCVGAGSLCTGLQQRAPRPAPQVQYRMHPELSLFPNHRFYGGRLSDGVEPHQRTPPAGLRWPPGPQGALPLLFINVNGDEVGGRLEQVSLLSVSSLAWIPVTVRAS